MNLVTSPRTLEAMEKAGHVVLHPHTGRKMKNAFGAETRVCYVDEVPREFVFRGRRYGRRWIDGSFCPYVEDMGPEDGE